MPDPTPPGELQRYTLDRPIELRTSRKALWRSIRDTLRRASDAKKIASAPDEILKYVLLLPSPPSDVLEKLRAQNLHEGSFCIVGGVKNQNRDPALPHLKRNDGAWFDFAITAREVGDNVSLLAYDFEIRLPPGLGAPFLRFDLNVPDHRNQDRELRCHLHPGSDDILVPAPLMEPLELLTLFIERIRLPDVRKSSRTPTGFEKSWLKDTLARLA